MSTFITKETLIKNMGEGYVELERLLAPLSETQMTSPNVNGPWSVKDNLAHLSAWQKQTGKRLQALQQGGELPNLTPELSEDEINEQYYQANKDRSLDDVRNEFHETYQHLLVLVQSTSEEDLNKPLAGLEGDPIWTRISGNTYEHYQEHGQIIQNWFARTA